jgi:glycosyltransferase involved in cell wall biosynthesis
MAMRLTVVVPVRDGQNVLPDCLSGIWGSSRRPDEVLVVDDGSSDASAVVARAYGAQVICHGGAARGPAWARNVGAAHAVGDILVFVDADVVVHLDTLEKIEGKFAVEPRLEALFGSYDARPRVLTVASRFKNLLHHYVHQHGKLLATSFWAGCGAIRRQTLLDLGGFDERYSAPSIEDIELGRRLVRAQKLIRLCPEIQCTHLKHWTLWSIVRTDVCARAVPWTRLVLSEGKLPDDLNLSWKSRWSAVFAWGGVSALVSCFGLMWVGSAAQAAMALVAGVLCLLATTLLNAELYRFFFSQGGAVFACSTWFLHQAYLLYSSATFAVLASAQAMRLTSVRAPWKGRRPQRLGTP